MRKLLASLVISASLFAPLARAEDDPGLAAFYKQDYATAMSIWKEQADKGDAHAQASLGVLYANGLGTPRDDVQAFKWFAEAARQGDSSGQYNMGVMSRDGRATPKSSAEAVRWFRLAAAQGDSNAKINLGA
ncbi:MAG: sel1 repeat family protein, partial [Burkholderiaceae bacterium]|nr:sel1 repeat family protein [Burkholderiaceae bacterium]